MRSRKIKRRTSLRLSRIFTSGVRCISRRLSLGSCVYVYKTKCCSYHAGWKHVHGKKGRRETQRLGSGTKHTDEHQVATKLSILENRFSEHSHKQKKRFPGHQHLLRNPSPSPVKVRFYQDFTYVTVKKVFSLSVI